MIAFARMLDDEQSPHVEQVLLKTRVHCIGPAVRMFALHYLVIHTFWEQEQEAENKCHSIPKEMERVPGCPMPFWNILD